MESLNYTKFKQLRFVHIEDSDVENKLKNKHFTKIIVDVLDGDLWSSKVSFVGNLLLIFLIIISSLEIIISSDSAFSNYAELFKFVYISTSVLFTIEIFARIIYAGYVNPKHPGIKGSFYYLFSFYGIIDVLSILPFMLGIFGLHSYHYLKILRIFRIWRIVRYIPAFSSISNAFKSKRDEILVSLLGVILLSVTLSAFIYYAESVTGSKDFKSIVDVFVWSIGKYTGDYGAIASAAPITLIGKFLATINGLLGIALFAVPAGLLGSAFIDELSEMKKRKEITDKINAVNKYFNIGYQKKTQICNKKAHWRFVTFEELQSRTLLTNDEIFEVIKASCTYRFRATKSSEDLTYSDMKIIERFENNTSYGCRKINNESNVYIISPLNTTERFVGHFTSTIADNLGYNYISRERRLYTNDDVEIGSGNSIFYANFDETSKKNISAEFSSLMNDLKQIKKQSWVFVFRTGATTRADFEITFGKKVNSDKFDFENSTINDAELFLKLDKNLNIEIEKANFETPLTLKYHSFECESENLIESVIRKRTNASVVTIYLNVKHIKADNKTYFEYLNILMTALEQAFGNHKTEDNG